MTEALRQLIPGSRSEVDSAIGGLMITQVLKEKRLVKAEELVAERIAAVLYLQEIQFVHRFPIDPPEEPIDIRPVKLQGSNDQGVAVFLVLEPKWLEEAWLSDDPAKRELLYEKLKLALKTIDALKRQGEAVLDKPRTKKILQKE